MTQYDKTLTVLNLGGGVQSSVMLLLANEGKLPRKPEHAIFADTGWEPYWVYDQIEFLKSISNIPVHIVKNKRSLKKNLIEGTDWTGKHKFVDIPVFFYNKEGKKAKNRRQCTSNYKIRQISIKTRELLGIQRMSPNRHVWNLLGISTDEIFRVKPSSIKHFTLEYPLIELNMSRQDCIDYWKSTFPNKELKKSSCIGCPYHDLNWFKDVKDNHPREWQDLIFMDEKIRANHNRIYGKDCFITNQMVPVVDLDFTILNNSTFEEECEGYCEA